MSEVRKRLRDDLHGSGVADLEAFDCLVAVTEACSNALTHGHGPDSADRPPQVEWTISSGDVTMVVRDFSGHGWEDTAYTAVPFDAYAAAPETRIGGLGLSLMAQVMDQTQIDRTGRGTTVTLKKFLNGRVPAIS